MFAKHKLFADLFSRTTAIFCFLAFSCLMPVAADVLIYHEDFSKYPDGSLPAGWWIEGSTKAGIKDHRLHQYAVPGYEDAEYGFSTIWLNQEFSGDLRVEFDAHVLYSPETWNNIIFLFLYSDTTGRGIYETRNTRPNGQARHYHSGTLAGYFFTYVANRQPNNARVRLRDCPGNHLLQESFGYENRQGKTYHVVITKIGNRLTHSVDGHVYIDMVDHAHNPEHRKGIMGFRTYKTNVWWDNLKVIQLNSNPVLSPPTGIKLRIE